MTQDNTIIVRDLPGVVTDMYASAQTRQLETSEPADAATRESLAPNFTFIAR
jgi:hypothetical protein